MAKKKNEDLEIKTATTPNITDADVTDIDLSAIRKKRFRIDGDNNRILELNTSDMGIVARIREVADKMSDGSNKFAELFASEEEVSDEQFSAVLAEVDRDMREMLDYIFDTNISEVCAPFGTMYDPVGGQFRFEHIVETFGNLYGQNLTAELKSLSDSVDKYTAKYVKKK